MERSRTRMEGKRKKEGVGVEGRGIEKFTV
jgi:hypothetical protein